ncbi:hypothetical protein NQ314_017147 [Rhamnusium bicolor]|uniref:Uncharacterized protein n=1 Tax=Rhamnusium bicolor TaxID=1586634 RepID=A0AAV8WVA7_9CUCU|nr:hypothetical protein NQ314_017147 [Rhamnusium bicolor]
MTTPIQNKSTDVEDHEYYGQLIESYTRSILKSGLLLDEDLEALLSIFKFRNLPEQSKYRPSLSLFAGFISMLASSYIAKKYQLPLVVIPSLIFTLKAVTSEVKSVKRRKNNREIINKLIEVINKVHKLNISIIRYMKVRVDLGKTKEQEFQTLHNRSVAEFLDTLSRNDSLFQFLIDNLKSISMYSDALFDDCQSLEDLKPMTILQAENVNNIENCLALTQKRQDLHVLFASKLLSYIGIIFHTKTSNLGEKDLNSLINERLPNIVRNLQEHHEFVKRHFVSLRQSVRKKTEYKLQARRASRKQIATRLQDSLVYSVNNLSVILEKSQNVLDRIENGDEEIGNAIVDLKNHTFATYESLDILCKLYGILSNSTNDKQNDRKITNSVKADYILEEKFPTVNYDDSIEPLEEKFELYIGEENDAKECPTTNYDEEQSGAYLSLMLQELKQSLKQHQRFIDAKNKRGSEDDEEMDRIPVVKLKKSPPKFNLKALRDECEQGDIPELPHLVDIGEPVVPLELPMPPPPPLPSFSLNNLEEETGRVNARSMLDNIIALSSQRNAQEDVFGDSDVESNCSD